MFVLALVLGAAFVAVSPLTAAERNFQRNAYTVTPLVSDQPGFAPHTDGNLVNAWGLTAGRPLRGGCSTTAWTSRRSTTATGRRDRSWSTSPAARPAPCSTDYRLPAANRRQGAVPVRRRGRHHPGLERRPGHDRGRRQGSFRPEGDLQGPDRRRYRGGAAPLCRRLPQRADRRVRRQLRARARQRVPRSVACRRATPRSTSRRSVDRVFVAYAKQDADAEDEDRRSRSRLRRPPLPWTAGLPRRLHHAAR